jgi:hypothetical protein
VRTPTRSARNGEAGRDGESGGDAAERPNDAAARQGSSGEVARSMRCMGSTSNGTGALLTSLRGSWVASLRRSGGEGEESKAAATLNIPGGLSWRAGHAKGARRSRTPRRRRGLGRVRVGDGEAEGMTGGTLGLATAGRGGGLAELGRAELASWAATLHAQAGLRARALGCHAAKAAAACC